MKPYFSQKSCGTQSKIILQDNDKIVTKNVDVAEVFNKFFVPKVTRIWNTTFSCYILLYVILYSCMATDYYLYLIQKFHIFHSRQYHLYLYLIVPVYLPTD
jgi:hypothetical protein